MTSGEMRVVDEDGREVPADGETLGEIVVRGNVVMEGYYSDPEATATRLPRRLVPLGRCRGRASRRLRRDPRPLKDVIISGGENISSVEVEGVLLRHPAVQEVAVVGLPHEKWGEAPHAFVVLKPGASATAEDEMRGFARERLAHFKVPKGLTVRRASCPRRPPARSRSTCCAAARGHRAAVIRHQSLARSRLVMMPRWTR